MTLVHNGAPHSTHLLRRLCQLLPYLARNGARAHDSEEEVLFPGIEEATAVKGIMDGEKAEHGKYIRQ